MHTQLLRVYSFKKYIKSGGRRLLRRQKLGDYRVYSGTANAKILQSIIQRGSIISTYTLGGGGVRDDGIGLDPISYTLSDRRRDDRAIIAPPKTTGFTAKQPNNILFTVQSMNPNEPFGFHTVTTLPQVLQPCRSPSARHDLPPGQMDETVIRRTVPKDGGISQS